MGASVKVLGTDSSISAAALLLSPHPLRSSSTGILMYPTTEDRPEIAQQAGHQSGRSKNSPKDLLCPATHFFGSRNCEQRHEKPVVQHLEEMQRDPAEFGCASVNYTPHLCRPILPTPHHRLCIHVQCDVSSQK